MKKLLSLTLVLFLLTACSSGKNALYKEKLDLYQSYWTVIQDQETYQSSSEYYTITVEYSKGAYSVTLDNARVAMMDVEILAIENEGVFQTDKMMPSAGIFEEPIDLIPNQSKPDSDFKAGIRVNGESSGPLTLHVMVSWRSLSSNEVHREFFEFHVEETEAGTVDEDSNDTE